MERVAALSLVVLLIGCGEARFEQGREDGCIDGEPAGYDDGYTTALEHMEDCVLDSEEYLMPSAIPDCFEPSCSRGYDRGYDVGYQSCYYPARDEAYEDGLSDADCP